jgi:hypothetical protein
VFTWIGHERLSISEVCRRLQRAAERTRTGRTQWDRSVVWDMLQNPAYSRKGGIWQNPPRATAAPVARATQSSAPTSPCGLLICRAARGMGVYSRPGPH